MTPSSSQKAILLVTTLASCQWAQASPLFQDTPEQHWALEAVTRLAQKDLIKGFPDGTFRGGLATSRYEVAYLLEKTLAYLEEHEEILSEDDLNNLHALMNNYRQELKALDYRTETISERIKQLERTLDDLESIHYHGEVEVQATFQSFHNTGNVENDRAIPVDYPRGRPLFNGTGFTVEGVFGLEAELGESWNTDIEFSAFSGQGSEGVDAYWGLDAFFLNSPWTAGSIGNGDNSHNPYSRVVLDHATIQHENSGLSITLGAFNDDLDRYSHIVYGGQPNPAFFGTRFMPSYGFEVTDDIQLSNSMIDWEILLTKLPSSAYRESPGSDELLENAALDTYMYGGNLGLDFEAGHIRLNYLHSFTDSSESDYDRIAEAGGIGPYSQFDLAQDLFFEEYLYGANPSDTTLLALTLDHTFDLDSLKLNFSGSYGYSHSSVLGWATGGGGVLGDDFIRTQGEEVSNSGNALRLGVGFDLFDDSLSLTADYLSVDGSYDPIGRQYPYIAEMPGIYQTFPFIHRPRSQWFLHDTERYPHNREGFELGLDYRFNEDRGGLQAQYLSYQQRDFGWEGGAREHLFIDPVFTAVDGDVAGNQRGDITGLDLGFEYDFGTLSTSLGWQQYSYQREAALANNNIDFDHTLISLELQAHLSDDFTLIGGGEIAEANGVYLSPTGDTNLDHSQFIPYLGFEHDLTEGIEWNFLCRYYSGTGSDTGGRLGLTPTINAEDPAFAPFRFRGLQVTTGVAFGF